MTLHIRYKPETRGIITAADLARMKPTALIVNTSRGPLIRESVLIEALRAGRPGYAALDVFENEPLSGPAHPLLNMPNVTCTPHIGGLVHSTYENWYGTAIDAILGLEAGKPVNVINPEVLRSG